MNYKVGDEVYTRYWAPATLGRGLITEVLITAEDYEYVIYWSGTNKSGTGWRDEDLTRMAP